MKSYNEIVKSVDNVLGQTINIYGCWDDVIDYNDGCEPDFYDVYADDGVTQWCLNEGDPFYYIPTKKELIDLVKSFEL